MIKLQAYHFCITDDDPIAIKSFYETGIKMLKNELKNYMSDSNFHLEKITSSGLYRISIISVLPYMTIDGAISIAEQLENAYKMYKKDILNR